MDFVMREPMFLHQEVRIRRCFCYEVWEFGMGARVTHHQKADILYEGGRGARGLELCGFLMRKPMFLHQEVRIRTGFCYEMWGVVMRDGTSFHQKAYILWRKTGGTGGKEMCGFVMRKRMFLHQEVSIPIAWGVRNIWVNVSSLELIVKLETSLS